MRKTMLFILFAALLASLAQAEIIRLKNGVELHCEILSCHEDSGVTVRRLDNGGVFELGWENIIEADVKAVKYACGISMEEAKLVAVRAKRIWLRNGTFEDGVQAESDRPGSICIRRKGKHYYFIQSQVKDIENVQVEAKDVYTLEELYQRKLQDGMPETTMDFFDLGIYLESVTYYEMALEMYQKVAELDPSYKDDVVQRKLDLMAAKIEEADATAMLDDIKQLIYRRKYALALQRIVQFEEQFPASVQMGDKEKLKSEALTKRHDYYQQKILTDYFSYMDRIANKVATDRDIPIDAALDFAAEDMGITIREKISEVYKLQVEEVEELWSGRSGGAPRTSTYGTGTFILGPEKAKLIPQDEEAEEEEKKKDEEEPKSVDERLKKKMEEIKKLQNKIKSKRKSRIRLDDIGRSPEDWWSTESITNRKRFLISYYAEESGDMKIKKVRLNPCPSCNGRGWLEFMNTSGEESEKEPCEVCKTLGIERTVIFK